MSDPTRPGLTRDRVVDAALVAIEERGLSRLTMRDLGARLGVEAMSLYRYVPSRDDLLDAVCERVMAELVEDPEVHARPDADWQDFLRRLAHGMRRAALARPRTFPLVASRPPSAPWIRPPLRSLDWIEAFVAGLGSCGFSDDAAVAAYRSFSSFLLGHLLLEVAGHGGEFGPLDRAAATAGGDDDDADDGADEGADDGADGLAGHPVLRRLRHRLAEDHAAAEFAAALEELLGRIAATAPPAP